MYRLERTGNAGRVQPIISKIHGLRRTPLVFQSTSVFICIVPPLSSPTAHICVWLVFEIFLSYVRCAPPLQLARWPAANGARIICHGRDDNNTILIINVPCFFFFYVVVKLYAYKHDETNPSVGGHEHSFRVLTNVKYRRRRGSGTSMRRRKSVAWNVSDR